MIEIQESLLNHGHECLRECQAMLSRHDRAITVPDIESIIGKFNKSSAFLENLEVHGNQQPILKKSIS